MTCKKCGANIDTETKTCLCCGFKATSGKSKTWLWVLGWIFIFPLPLTLLLMRKKSMNNGVKYGVLGAAWGFFLIALAGAASGSSDPNVADTQQPVAVAHQGQTEAVTNAEKQAAQNNVVELQVTEAQKELVRGMPNKADDEEQETAERAAMEVALASRQAAEEKAAAEKAAKQEAIQASIVAAEQAVEASRQAEEQAAIQASIAAEQAAEESRKAAEKAAEESRQAAEKVAEASRQAAELAAIQASIAAEQAAKASRQAAEQAAIQASKEAAAAAEKAAAEKAAKAATNPPTKSIQVTSGLEFRRNEYATISINGQPGVQYIIAVYYNSGASKAKGLEPKVADANGNVSWTWKIGPNTAAGTYRVEISGNGEMITKHITVIES